MRKKQQAEKLLRKYQNGQCSEEEKRTLANWYETWHGEAQLLSEDELEAAEKEMWEAIQKPPVALLTRKSYTKWMAAAGIALLALFFVYQQSTKHPRGSVERRLLVHDVNPGGDRARLTLADGSELDLTTLKAGEVFEQNGFRVVKKENGQLVYTATEETGKAKRSALVTFNEIHTPKGGQFQLQLSDGTKVWLNAASSIRYPLDFGENERRVELVGEAYFEVAKKQHPAPFVVQTSHQEVYVLGTHFNVSAYENEMYTKTTLVEGKVKVRAKGHSSAVVLKPNEQSVLLRDEPSLRVQQVDPAESIAWKEGDFFFNNTDLKTIMRQLERWYDVSVDDLDNFPDNSYNGKMKRAVKLSKVLRILEMTSELQFVIEEETLTGHGKRIRLIK